MTSQSITDYNHDPITACVYDEKRSGIWLLFTQQEPEFIANIEPPMYVDILLYLSRYGAVREQITRFFYRWASKSS